MNELEIKARNSYYALDSLEKELEKSRAKCASCDTKFRCITGLANGLGCNSITKMKESAIIANMSIFKDYLWSNREEILKSKVYYKVKLKVMSMGG